MLSEGQVEGQAAGVPLYLLGALRRDSRVTGQTGVESCLRRCDEPSVVEIDLMPSAKRSIRGMSRYRMSAAVKACGRRPHDGGTAHTGGPAYANLHHSSPYRMAAPRCRSADERAIMRLSD
jgi:hypothetical protein